MDALVKNFVDFLQVVRFFRCIFVRICIVVPLQYKWKGCWVLIGLLTGPVSVHNLIHLL
jgi:hypothetical protein